ncbi:MAG: anhydro-N-acetylmuramic acid kinase [Candidatus Thiodiazotropha sp.]
MPNRQIFIGLISGTSLDGVDAVLVSFEDNRPHLLATHHEPYPAAIKQSIRDLCLPGSNEIDRMGSLDRLVAEVFSHAALRVVEAGGLTRDAIAAIGCHGQTIRHRPELTPAFTLQICDPNTLSELTGITTVADFRRRDMACGGQGAPLVPAYHKALFQQQGQSRIVLNLGGIANITCLPADTALPVTGYDTGPANTLLDSWAERHIGTCYDDQGGWARSGSSHPVLLDRLLEYDYFSLPAPKSTGTETFNLNWLLERVEQLDVAPADVQATLVELTVQTVAQAIEREGYASSQILICGGGVHNDYLLERLSIRLPECSLSSTQSYGVEPDWVEAITFAWLAKRTLSGLSGNLPSVTGATRELILGGIYPAS